MSKALSFSIVISILNLVISLVYAFFQNGSFFIHFINSFFTIGMVYLLVGALLFVTEAGFFNGIIYSFKKLRKSTAKGKYVSNFDDLDDTKEIHEEYNKERRFNSKKPLLIIGGFYCFAGFLLSFLLYS
ncbi:hypothetical protein JOC86_003071 [Bacillus pakistanensis]|uniref:DUF3899 domain-containing protein n=1 Tax=Rossellomorea pakistanensis TaxID=992288 RepID=A0ABS2NFH9_9BACI|nr:DUF3899 domain-containing protein [Bacillus pakistanensis]MBM7586519.1 hypothetical protein [Bacillus pakistanensis]